MPYSWTGFYVGAQAGGGWNNSRWDDAVDPVFNTNGSGAIFGGQIGYNYQINQFVIGMEVDLAGSTAQGAAECAANQVCEAKQDYLASARGRLGYTIDRLHVYGDGGLAFTNYKFDSFTSSFHESFSGGSRVGWTAGLGVEYAFTDHWTGGFEWNYYDFGSKAGQNSTPGFFINIRNTENVAVARVNYKF